MDNTKRTNSRMDPVIRQKLEEMAAEDFCSISKEIQKLVVEAWDRRQQVKRAANQPLTAPAITYWQPEG
jgi:hypothetical protein